jgi:hypothetical protein
MSASSLRARIRRSLFAFGLSTLGIASAAAMEVATVREPLRDVGPFDGLVRLVLEGPDAPGGLSGVLWDGGDRLLFVSDRGRLFSAAARRDEAGALADLVDWTSHRPPYPGGRSDLEGLAVSEGQLLVSVELRPYVMRFEGPLARPERMVSYFTRDRLGFPNNAGFEALVDLPGDGWLAVAESRGEDGAHVAYTRDRRRLSYRTGEGFAPTGADRLGGRLFFVERRVSLLSGWQARITCVDVAAVGAGAVLEPVVLADLGFADGIDNMEGIAVRADGRDLELVLVSDDNMMPFQRTLVLHYRWPGAASGGCGP